jgi:hypothetical protein
VKNRTLHILLVYCILYVPALNSFWIISYPWVQFSSVQQPQRTAQCQCQTKHVPTYFVFSSTSSKGSYKNPPHKLAPAGHACPLHANTHRSIFYNAIHTYSATSITSPKINTVTLTERVSLKLIVFFPVFSATFSNLLVALYPSYSVLFLT